MPRQLHPLERRRRDLRQQFRRFRQHRYRELRDTAHKWLVILNRVPIDERTIERAKGALKRLEAAETKGALARAEDRQKNAKDDAAKAKRRLWLIRQPWARVGATTRARYEAMYGPQPPAPKPPPGTSPVPIADDLETIQRRANGGRP